jgi:tellurite methyltransferase
MELRNGLAMNSNQSITFFDTQFQTQVAGRDFALNPFEKAALPFVHGRVLDLGCGLGNLCIEAARRGAEVVAVDASETAIKRIRDTAAADDLSIEAVLADVSGYVISRQFDTIVAIGLLMFFERARALALLDDIQAHVGANGRAIINVLTAGTSYLDMFEPGRYYLFGRSELEERFKGWNILLLRHDSFDAPGNTKKEFATIVARKE